MAFASVYPHYIAKGREEGLHQGGGAHRSSTGPRSSQSRNAGQRTSTGDGQRRTGLCGQDSADLPVTQDLAADALGQERLSVAEGQFVDPVAYRSAG